MVGKWLKIGIGLLYIFLFILISSNLLQYFSSALRLIYYPNTTVYIIVSVFLIAAVITNRVGFKAISNINLIILPLRLN
ncbi:MAG: GerAB/ArcD/ProY family transporter [Clostridia bacterium]|nr:GerAB/ArcD/ProY family transporter [Clostridia bacterium]